MSHSSLSWRAAGLAAFVLAGWARPAAAQRLIDWPIRTSVGAEAATGGATAAFWNPATAGLGAGRAEAFLMDIEGFRQSGLGGVAAAGALHLQPDLAVAAGFSHLGVGPIGLTATSPTDSLGDVNVSEDLLALSAARHLGHALWVGISAQYSRANDVADHRSQFGLGAGLAWSPGGRLQPTLGGSVISRQGATEWLAGVALQRLLVPLKGLRIGASYGLGGGADKLGTSQRAAVSARWRDLVGAAVALDGEPGAGGTTWEPLLGVNLQLGRYALAVLRESIANGFGAAYYYQLRVTF